MTHEYKCYLFKEGYIRMSSREYSLDPSDIENAFIHLTNNAIQKMDKSGYGSFEQGNVLSFSQAQAAIQEESDREVNFYTLCQQKILQTIRTSMISVR